LSSRRRDGAGLCRPTSCLAKAWTFEQLKATKIVVAYDGTPQSSDPFATQDNWNIKKIHIDAQSPVQHLSMCVLDASADPYLARLRQDNPSFTLSDLPSTC
jgi:hypothetical protein